MARDSTSERDGKRNGENQKQRGRKVERKRQKRKRNGENEIEKKENWRKRN